MTIAAVLVRRAFRRGAATTTFFAVLSVVLTASVNVAARFPDDVPIRVSDELALRYDVQSLAFNPLASDSAYAASAGEGWQAPADVSAGPEHATERSGPSTTPSAQPRPTEEEEPAAFSVVVSADRDKARPGDVITFTTVTTNRSSEPLKAVKIHTHVPTGTMPHVATNCFVTPDPNDSSTKAGAAVCEDDVVVVVPEGEHLTRYVPVLEPYVPLVWTVRVKVDPSIKMGSLIEQHAHATGNGVPEVLSNVVIVEVG